MELLQKIVKRVKYINYFCNNLRCLIGFEYTSEEYPGNTEKNNLQQLFLQSSEAVKLDSNIRATGLHQRENLKENIIATY